MFLFPQLASPSFTSNVRVIKLSLSDRLCLVSIKEFSQAVKVMKKSNELCPFLPLLVMKAQCMDVFMDNSASGRRPANKTALQL